MGPGYHPHMYPRGACVHMYMCGIVDEVYDTHDMHVRLTRHSFTLYIRVTQGHALLKAVLRVRVRI